MNDAADPVQEIAELRVLLAEREAELAVARAELTGAKLRIEQYQAQLAKLRRMRAESRQIRAMFGCARNRGTCTNRLNIRVEVLKQYHHLEEFTTSKAPQQAPGV